MAKPPRACHHGRIDLGPDSDAGTPAPPTGLATVPRLGAILLEAPVAVLTLDDEEPICFGCAPSDIPADCFVNRPPRNGDGIAFAECAADRKLRDDPLVASRPELAASAVGVTLRDAAGRALGSLWVLDGTRHDWDDAAVDRLRPLGDHAAVLHGVLRDREQVRGERQQLAVRSATLTRAFEERTTFLAMAQHKLKTPLAIVSGWADALCASVPLSEEEREYGTAAIQNAAAELRLHIDDLLDEARTALIAEAIDTAPIELRPFVADVLETSRADPATHPSSNLVGDGVVVLADTLALREVLAHLLDNARKYSPDGGPIVVDATGDDTVTITVTDSGIGLPSDIDVFAPFARDPDAARLARGTGLGLHIVRSLVERMDGSVRAESAPDGTGSRFSVSLPAAPTS